jgi:hypothetical protein|tara:strand:+ start:953 stop:1126 length:174 start_codon:yes stop_codon:yes gene_type:complete
MSTEDLLDKFNILQEKKKNTNDWMEQLEIQDEIHSIEMKLNGVKPTDSSIDCEGCGS